MRPGQTPADALFLLVGALTFAGLMLAAAGYAGVLP